MEQKAFELIQEKLQAALNEQGFGEAVALETDNGRGVMFTTGEVAYGLFYETKQRRFVLRSATMKTPKEPGDWRQLSMWLFDEGENTMQDAESIANDFLELVQGSKRRELVQTAKKRRKKEQDMLASLKKGDRVCTIGGIYATIESIRDDTITLSVGKGDQTMVVARWAIRSVEDVTIENETESLN